MSPSQVIGIEYIGLTKDSGYIYVLSQERICNSSHCCLNVCHHITPSPLERITIAHRRTYAKTSETTYSQSTNKTEARHSGGDIDILDPPFQPRIVLNRRGGHHAETGYVAIAQTERQEDEHVEHV